MTELSEVGHKNKWMQLKLKEDDAWQANADAAFEQITEVEEIIDIFGSITPTQSPTIISLENDKDKANTFLYHNGCPFDGEDMERLTTMGDTNSTRRKGPSHRGFALRCICRKYSGDPGSLSAETLDEYSYAISRIRSAFRFKNTEYKPGDIVAYLVGNNYQAIIIDKTSTDYSEVYEKICEYYDACLGDEYGVVFRIAHEYNLGDNDLKYKLRFVFNRCSYTINVNNVVITKNKPNEFIDKYDGGKYAKFNLEVRKIGTGYIGRVKHIDSQNVSGILDTYEVGLVNDTEDSLRGKTLDEWCVKKKISGDEWKRGTPVYSANIATQSVKMKDNALRRNYYGDDACNRVGITPYNGRQGLCSQVPAKKYDNNNLRAYLKGVVESDRSGTRNNMRGPYRIHDSQLYTAELVEERGKFEASMISVNVVKSKSDLINGGSKKTNNKSRPCFLHAIPHLITSLVVEFIFDKELKQPIPLSNTLLAPVESGQSIDALNAQLVKANLARNVAEREKVKAEEEKKQAQQKEALANNLAEEARVAEASAVENARVAAAAAEEARVAAAEESRVAAADAEEARVVAAEEARVAAAEEARAEEKKRIELEIIIEDNKTDMEAKEEENIELHDQVQQADENQDFNQSAKSKICQKQELVERCVLCNCKFVNSVFQYCHIVSKKNGGMGSVNNGVYACRYCNSGHNPQTYEAGMREGNLVPWLKKTYPDHADKVLHQLTVWGKDV